MKTITDLLKTRKLDCWLDTGDVWLEWENDSEQWVAYSNRNKPLEQRVLTTPNETEAVAAFVEAAGLNSHDSA